MWQEHIEAYRTAWWIYLRGRVSPGSSRYNRGTDATCLPYGLWVINGSVYCDVCLTRLFVVLQGWTPAYWRIGPHTVTTLLIMEKVRTLLGLSTI
jgi:hypothetical protein